MLIYSSVILWAYILRRNYFPIRGRAPGMSIVHGFMFNLLIIVPFIAEICWNIGITRVTNTVDVHWLTIAFSASWFSTRRTLYPFYFLKILYISLQRGISKIYSTKRLTKKRTCLIKFLSSEKYILLFILATWLVVFALNCIFNKEMPFDWSNFFSPKHK